MVQGKVLLVSTNLFFVPRIHGAAAANGLGLRMTTSEADFWKAYAEGDVSLILVDLEGEKGLWTKVVSGLKRERKASTKVIAFGPHADVALLEEARTLGCDQVLSKNQFNKDLAKVLKPG